MQGLRSNSALFWATQKAVITYPLLFFSVRVALGTPENLGVS